MPKPFRFGVAGVSARSGQEWREKAKKIEALGFDTLLVWDHLDTELAPLTALMAAAAATQQLRLGTLVLANDFRHPVLLAREIATLDLLSDGRVELGLGAGWNQQEFLQAGIPFSSAGERVSRLAESIQIIKQLFQPAPVSFSGKHYTVDQLLGKPTPIQRPHPPIMLGAARKQMLQLAAREADIIALATKVSPDGHNDFSDSLEEALARKIRYVNEHAGERSATLEFQIHIGGVIPSDKRTELAKQLGPTVGLTGEQLLVCAQALLGTEAEIIDDLLRRREQLGISYITIDEHSIEAFAPIVKQLRGK